MACVLASTISTSVDVLILLMRCVRMSSLLLEGQIWHPCFFLIAFHSVPLFAVSDEVGCDLHLQRESGCEQLVSTSSDCAI